MRNTNNGNGFMTPKDKDKQRNEAPEEPEAPGNAPEAETPATAEPEDDALAAAKKKAEEYLASLQRAQADFINYKRRTEQERQDFSRAANADLLKAILPVADDLERALENVPEDLSQHEWVEGIRLVERKFKASLENAGVKPVLALGMEFDPEYHEALRQDAGPDGVVIGEFQKGYTLHDKLLRPARVIVGNGEEPSKEEE